MTHFTASQHSHTTYLVQVERRALGTIVVIAIDMQDLLAFNGKQARENALGQAGAKYNAVIFFILIEIQPY
jgi:hypothetical protein